MRKINQEKIRAAVQTILNEIDQDSGRPGLAETPDRVARFYAEFFESSLDDISFVVKQFENSYGEQTIALTNIQFTSFCEHHLLPFHGIFHLAYVPDKTILGLSKLARIVGYFSKRLQLQEKLASQVVDFLAEKTSPKGAMAVVISRHSCVSCRGVKKNNAVMKSVYKQGIFRQNNHLSQEFIDLIKLNSVDI